MAKQYGLSFPQSKDLKLGSIIARPSIFNEDSDSDNPDNKPTGMAKGIKRQDKISQDKAVEQDPTVFQYDEIYDEMDKKRQESKLSRKDLDKKPKYVSKLLVAAEKRKRENERRIERQVQKEREQEGDLYKDKESFVTSAYKKKLEEMKKLDELEQREEYLEGIGDVRKQANLDGFYRHLYDQKINFEDKVDDVKTERVKEELVSGDESSIKRQKSSENVSDIDDVNKKTSKDSRQRKYRSRKKSEDENSDAEREVKKEHLPSNLDADSDFSIDSSDSEGESDKKRHKSDNKETKSEEQKKESVVTETEIVEEPKSEEQPEVKNEVIELKPKKPKIDIWKKRTVGEKFDEAVKRYFDRKSSREVG